MLKQVTFDLSSCLYCKVIILKDTQRSQNRLQSQIQFSSAYTYLLCVYIRKRTVWQNSSAIWSNRKKNKYSTSAVNFKDEFLDNVCNYRSQWWLVLASFYCLLEYVNALLCIVWSLNTDYLFTDCTCIYDQNALLSCLWLPTMTQADLQELFRMTTIRWYHLLPLF